MYVHVLGLDCYCGLARRCSATCVRGLIVVYVCTRIASGGVASPTKRNHLQNTLFSKVAKNWLIVLFCSLVGRWGCAVAMIEIRCTVGGFGFFFFFFLCFKSSFPGWTSRDPMPVI